MNGLTVYRKRGDANKWLMYHPRTKSWQVQETSRKGTSMCCAALRCGGPCLPENGPERTWRVGTDGTDLQLQADVTVSIATLQQVQTYDDEIAAAAAAFAERIRVDGFKVKIFLYTNDCFIKSFLSSYFIIIIILLIFL